MDRIPDITPQTRIGEMLEAYPQVEEILLKLSPSFAKLRNPILRKTIGRIATLRQAAEIGNVNLGTMISELRKAAGISELLANDSQDEIPQDQPEWVNPKNISIIFDASGIIEAGGNPMKNILEKAEQLEQDKVMLLIVPFKPAPIIGLLETKGYTCWSEENGDKVNTYIKRKTS